MLDEEISKYHEDMEKSWIAYKDIFLTYYNDKQQC